jgi:aldose sugar dehydrogenase
MKRARTSAVLLALILVSGACNRATRPDPDAVQDSEEHRFRLEVVTDGLEHPWGLAFLPDGNALVTERPGRLSRVDLATGRRVALAGVPEVSAVGQGGMLDVALHPDFAENRLVYLTWAGPADAGSGHATHLGRGRLDGDRLEDFEVLHVATPFLGSGQHFGSRIVFDDAGHVYFTVGDRGDRDRAQDRSEHMGSLLRLTSDGAIPADNPFVGEADALPAIYSFGHRNPQGLTVHPETRRLWLHEHGPRGGDEINLPVAGGNFGWPLTSYGTEYGTRRAIGPDPHEHAGTVPPIHHWEDSFAPSGMVFYDADAFPGWRGDLFMGSLVRQFLARLTVDGETIVGEERLLEGLGWRIRDVRVGPEGHLFVLVDARDAPMVRLVPAD